MRLKRKHVSKWKVYCIVDGHLMKHKDLAKTARRLFREGVDVVQVRSKNAPSYTLVRTAREIGRIAERYGKALLVNDRIDVAHASRADGVHLGNGDFPASRARRLLGKQSIIGKTVHTRKQARRQGKGTIDYVSAGPVFKTPLKKGLARRGLRFIGAVKKSVKKPLFAIGGIDADNMVRVLQSGADGVCVVRASVHAGRLVARARKQVSV
jgi:thiamine-phosphate pyrophosphorylase